jgi:transcription antitermination factor NusG
VLHHGSAMESDELWVALFTRAEREKLVDQQLRAQGYDSFCPTYSERRKWSDRIKTVERPLFPSYVFCLVNPKRRLPILVTPGVIQIVSDRNGPLPVERSELDAIRRLVTSELKYEQWPFCKRGEKVEIQRGPLAGVTGLFVETKSAGRVVLTVDLLQRSVAVEMSRDDVKPLRIRPVYPVAGSCYSKVANL